MLFIIVSLTYIFLWEAHTHTEAYLLPQLCVRFISGCPTQTLAVSRLWGFSSNAALMNTTYLLLVNVDYIIPVMDVKIRQEP